MIDLHLNTLGPLREVTGEEVEERLHLSVERLFIASVMVIGIDRGE
jgi:hypothetical protein